MVINNKSSSATVCTCTVTGQDTALNEICDIIEVDSIFLSNLVLDISGTKELRVVFKMNDIYHALYVTYFCRDEKIKVHSVKYVIALEEYNHEKKECLKTDIFLSLKHNGRVKLKNLAINKFLEFPSVRTVTDTLEFEDTEKGSVIKLAWFTEILDSEIKNYEVLSLTTMSIYFNEIIEV